MTQRRTCDGKSKGRNRQSGNALPCFESNEYSVECLNRSVLVGVIWSTSTASTCFIMKWKEKANGDYGSFILTIPLDHCFEMIVLQSKLSHSFASFHMSINVFAHTILHIYSKRKKEHRH